MSSRAPAILDHLASLADTTRSRLLLLLDRHELTVSELCGIMQLPSVHREPAPEGARGQRLDVGAGGRHESSVHDDARGARAGSPQAVAARPRSGGPTPAAGRTSVACRPRWPIGARSRRSSSRRPPVNGTVFATSSRRALSPRRARGARAGRLGAGRSGLRHGANKRRPRAVCRRA